MAKNVIKKEAKGFWEFVRRQDVFGFALGFILGAAVSKIATSFVNDIINPLLGIIMPDADRLSSAYLEINGSKIMYGNFISATIDFLIIALVVYLTIKKLGIKNEDLDKKRKVRIED